MKLTPQQIENWRKVLISQHGMMAFFLSDEDIERYRDEVNARVGENIWVVQVCFKDDMKSWDEIEPEPVQNKRRDLETMKLSCSKLLDKYPAIDSIRIHPNDCEIYFVIRR